MKDRNEQTLSDTIAQEAADTPEFARVLVVNGEPFWRGSATGLTISSLFRGWPRERLACLYNSEITPERTVCERYWRLAATDLRYIHGTLCRLRSHDGASRLAKNANADLSPQSSDSSVMRAVKRLRKRLAGQSVRDLDVYTVPQNVLEEITRFSPQVIYSTLASNPLMHLVTEISDRFQAPIVPHFMDDWPSTLYRSAMLRSVLQPMMHRRLQQVLARSPVRLVISDAMADEYLHRYGGPCVPFMNAVEPSLLVGPFTFPPPRETLRLVYVGGLHLNRWRPLQDIAAALAGLANQGLRAEAVVYTQPRFADEAKSVNIPPVMRLGGSLMPGEVTAVLRDADVLIHVESFDRVSRAYTRYSVSAKIPESLCAARPILAYGPEELASVRYIQESGTGVAVTRPGSQQLTNSLRQLLSSPHLRETLGKRGHEVAFQRHNAALQRAALRSVLQWAAAGDYRAERLHLRYRRNRT